MKSQLTKEVIKRLDKVGEVATEGAVEGFNFIFPLAVKNQIIWGIIGIATGALLFIGSLLLRVYAKKTEEKELKVVFSYIAIIFFAFGVLFIFMNLPQVINAEYYALRELLQIMK